MARRLWIPLLVLIGSACNGGSSISSTIPASAPLAQRIVSLSATATEMLYAIDAGSRLVGTDLTADYPPEAGATAKVDAFNFNVEAVSALEPDLVVLAFNFNDEVATLQKAGIPALLLPPVATLEGSYDQIITLGEVTGKVSEARRLADGLREEIEGIIDEASVRPSVPIYHEVDGTLFSANSRTFLGDIYKRFGLDNIADRVPDDFGSGYVQLSAEFVLQSDPELIFIDGGGGESSATLAARPGWGVLQAVQAGRIFVLDADLAGRWGPRTGKLVRAIADAVASLP